MSSLKRSPSKGETDLQLLPPFKRRLQQRYAADGVKIQETHTHALQGQQHTTWKLKNMTMNMTGVMRKDALCVCEICANALLLLLNYRFISKHSVVCINPCQLWFVKASHH